MFTWADIAHVLLGARPALAQTPSPWGQLLMGTYVLMRLVLAVRQLVRVVCKHKGRIAQLQLRMAEIEHGVPASALLSENEIWFHRLGRLLRRLWLWKHGDY